MTEHPSIVNHPTVDQWIQFTDEGRVIVHTGKVDIGQRISTALAIIAAEELDVDYERIDVKPAQTGTAPDEGYTASSMSMQQSGTAIRLASATARRHLLGLAGRLLDADPLELRVEDGVVHCPGHKDKISYWSLATDRPFGIPVDQAVSIKDPGTHVWIGRPVIAKGMIDIVAGKTLFVHDMTLPGMLHARPVRPPCYTAKLTDLDKATVRQLSDDGISVVRDGSFVAVASADEFAAVKAAERIAAAASWTLTSKLPTGDLYDALVSNVRLSRPVTTGGIPVDESVPPLAEPPADATVTLKWRFEKPYLMHGAIGPSAACALYDEGRLRVYTHSQGIYPLREALAEALQIAPQMVHVVFMPGAGCYGHNGADDAAFDAALIATMIPGRPVLLKWTRDDEHAWEPYGSAMVCELRGSLNSAGRIVDWSHESYGDTFIMGRPAAGRTGSPASKLLSSKFRAVPLEKTPPQPAMGPHVGIHRNLEPLYTLSNPRLVKHLVRGLPLRTSALRTLGAFANVVAIESFMDQLADAAGISPVELRLHHLADNRARHVIQLLADRMETDLSNSPPSRGQGMAFARYKNSAAYCAVGVELEISEKASVRLLHAWIVADAGEVVDPSGLTAQLEGGFIQAASWSLYESVSYDSQGITSRDWESYPIIRFDNVPEVRTLLVDRPGEPFLGAGEAVGGPAGGAIANAIYRASGLRLSQMPFDSHRIRSTALSE